MEGVGARLGRSSSRYGTTTVFNGPVRKWKKDWVPINPSSSSSSSSTNNNSSHHHHNNHNNHHHQNHHASANGSVNGGTNGSSSTVSHLRLYKWTPLNNKENSNNNSNSNDNNNNNNDKVGNKSKISGSKHKKDDDGVVANGIKDSSNEVDTPSQEPPRRKFKYIPIAVLEDQKKETEENTDEEDEAKPVDSEENTGEQASKSDVNDEKPDINDVPMEENQAEEDQTPPARQDLNELDLSLGLTSHDEEHDSDSKTDAKTDAQRESSNSGA